jgi:DNA-binding protein HU-beta
LDAGQVIWPAPLFAPPVDSVIFSHLTGAKYGSKWSMSVEVWGNKPIYHYVMKNTMANKMDLVEKVAATIGSTKADAERAVEAVIDMITSSLKGGQEVSIAGLGIFEAKMRAGRTGRNPRTGETIQIKAMRVPKFRASKTLKDAVK